MGNFTQVRLFTQLVSLWINPPLTSAFQQQTKDFLQALFDLIYTWRPPSPLAPIDHLVDSDSCNSWAGKHFHSLLEDIAGNLFQLPQPAFQALAVAWSPFKTSFGICCPLHQLVPPMPGSSERVMSINRAEKLHQVGLENILLQMLDCARPIATPTLPGRRETFSPPTKSPCTDCFAVE
jgi:hypothetical protein